MQTDKLLASIIIPYYGRWELVHQRMFELLKYAPDNIEIILVNDASPTEDCRKGAGFWQQYAKVARPTVSIRYKQNEENLGFGGSHNVGASMAKSDVLIFLSNDVKMYQDIVFYIRNILSISDRQLLGGRIIDWPAGWNEFTVNGTKYVVPYCEGFLLACTKRAWEELGGFDPAYGKYDYEDVDISTKALELGYNLYRLDKLRIEHIGGATINNISQDRLAHTVHNRNVYENKWLEKLPEVMSKGVSI